MSDTKSISTLIYGLKHDESDAQARIFRRYFDQLVQRSRRRQKQFGVQRNKEDASDIAIRTLESVFERARTGRLAYIEDRDGLEGLFEQIVKRKVLNQRREEEARRPIIGPAETSPRHDLGAKPQRGRVLREGAFAPDDSNYRGIQPEAQLWLATTEQLEATIEEEFGQLDHEFQQIVLYRFEQRTNAEIAQLTGVSLATVERRLGGLREIWQRRMATSLLNDARFEPDLFDYLVPRLLDLEAIFTTSVDARRVLDYVGQSEAAATCQALKNQLASRPDDVVVIRVRAQELRLGKHGDLPPQYVAVAGCLQRGVTLWGFRFVDADGHASGLFHALCFVNNRWVFAPEFVRAFDVR